VAATDIDNEIADFSNQNRWVELAAPGVGVLSTVPFIPNSYLFVGDEAYQGNPMDFSPYGTVTGELADGGLCLPTDTPGDWAGMVVLCERGDATFADKVTTVMDGGGAAAVVYNNAEGLFSGTLGAEGDWIVAISISQEDGQEALGSVGQEATAQSDAPIEGSGYEAWGGTSMATPHVSGVAALLWSANSNWTNAQIREAMTMTALDLGETGRDIAFGYGLVQAYDALQYLENMGPGQGPKGPSQ
jgi:subtilisin family serine protease